MTCKSVQIQVYTNIILSVFIYTICVCNQVRSNLVSGFAFHKQTKKLFDRFGTLSEHDLKNITDCDCIRDRPFNLKGGGGGGRGGGGELCFFLKKNILICNVAEKNILILVDEKKEII